MVWLLQPMPMTRRGRLPYRYLMVMTSNYVDLRRMNDMIKDSSGMVETAVAGPAEAEAACKVEMASRQAAEPSGRSGSPACEPGSSGQEAGRV